MLIRILVVFLLFCSSAHAQQMKLPESSDSIPSGRFIITPPGTLKTSAEKGEKKAETPPPAPLPAPSPLPVREDSGLSKAEFLLTRGKYSETLQETEGVLKRHPNNADAYTYRAIALRQLGENDKAAEQIKKALIINPHHLGANQVMGEILVEKGEIARALEQLAVIHMICGTVECAEETALENLIDNAKKEKSAK